MEFDFGLVFPVIGVIASGIMILGKLQNREFDLELVFLAFVFAVLAAYAVGILPYRS